jgi:omega-amidase
MRIALVQMAVTDGNVQVNLERAEAFVRDAASGERPDIILLPEMWTTGYAHDSWAGAADRETPLVMERLSALAQELKVSIGGSMVTRREDGALTNRFTIVSSDGSIVGAYDKSHLFSPLREKEFLAPGKNRVHATVGSEERVSAAMSICYDLRFPGMYRASAYEGVPLFLVVSAWPEPRCVALRTLARARAVENQAFLALCNRVGPSSDGTQFCGGSMVVSPTGELLLDLGTTEGVGVTTVRLQESAAARAALRVLEDEVDEIDFPTRVVRPAN